MDRAAPNLPAADFDRTERFYASVGFETRWRDREWMILARGSVVLEFFSLPGVDPLASCFNCCLRLDADTFYAACLEGSLPEAEKGQPRLHPLRH